MLKTTYTKFKKKYLKEVSSGLIFISYNNFTGDWEKDKRKYIRMINKERMLFGNSKLGQCDGCGANLDITNFALPISFEIKLCDECFEDYHTDN